VSSFFWTTYVSLWVLAVAIFIMVILLYRQLGLMLMLGRRRMELRGLDIGAKAPPLSLELTAPGERSFLEWVEGELTVGKKGWIVILAEEHCTICKGLWEKGIPAEFAGAWPDLELLWIDSDFRDRYDKAVGWQVAASRDGSAPTLFEIPGYPFGYAISGSGVITAKALINNMMDLTRLGREGFRQTRQRRDGASDQADIPNFDSEYLEENS
jgi:hypothetical protein